MPELRSTKTHDNLKHAFAAEAQANRRYLYFARRADIECYPEIGGLFRDTTEGFTEVAGWFETPARAEKSHAGRFQKGLDNLGSF